MAYTLPKNALQKAIELQGGPKAPTYGSQNMSYAQNMSVMPKKTFTPITTQSTGIPNVGIPGVKGLTTPIAPSTSSNLPPVTFSADRAKAINAPVDDVLGLARVNKTTPHYLKIKEHVARLQQKGRIDLTPDQSAYITRFKAKYPQYKNVPDVNLYVKNIQADPKIYEKYGNIGEKGFIERLTNLPFDIAKAGGEGVNEAIAKGEERKATLGQESGLRKATNILGITPSDQTINTLATAGRAVGNVAMGTAGAITNLASPFINPKKDVTSVTEGLQRDVGTAIQSVPEPVRNQVSSLIEKHPIISTYIGQGLDIANLIPVLGVLGKAKGAGEVETILKEIKARPATKFRGEASPEIYKAGTERSLIKDVASIPKKTVKAVTPDIIGKDVTTLRADRIEKGLMTQNNNLKTVGKAYKNNTKVQTLDDGTKQTITPIDTFKKYGIEPEITDKTIKMGDYKTTKEGALGKIQDNIEAIGDEMDTVLVNSGKRIKLAEMKAQAQKAIKNDPELKQAGKVSSTLKKLDDRFDDYELSYGDELDITEVNNIRKVANRDWSPDTQDVSSIVGDVGRDIVYNSTDDMYVRDLLREQGNLLAARKYAISLDGTKVRGGRLGDLVSGGTGAAVGAIAGMAIPIPIVGPAVGAAVGQKAGTTLSKLFSSSQFKSPLAELKGVFSKSGGVESPSIKVQRVPKVSTKSIEGPKATNQISSGNLSSPTKSVSSVQKLLGEPKKPQTTPGKTSVLSQLSKGKNKSASKDIKNSTIISKIAKKQETPKLPVKTEVPKADNYRVPDYIKEGGMPDRIRFSDRNGIRQAEFESDGAMLNGPNVGKQTSPTVSDELSIMGMAKEDYKLSPASKGDADGLYVLTKKGEEKLQKIVNNWGSKETAMPTKKDFIEETAGMKNGRTNFNRIFKVGDKTIANVAFSDKPWKIIDNKFQHTASDFDIISKRNYQPIKEFRTREDLMKELYKKEIPVETPKTPMKSALPMSQKSNVVYSKPMDTTNIRKLLKGEGLQQYENLGTGRLGIGNTIGDFSVKDEVNTTYSRLGKGYKTKTKSTPTGYLLIDGGGGTSLSKESLTKIKKVLDNQGIEYSVDADKIKIKK